MDDLSHLFIVQFYWKNQRKSGRGIPIKVESIKSRLCFSILSLQNVNFYVAIMKLGTCQTVFTALVLDFRRKY